MCVGCEQERERIADGLIGHDRIQRYIMANWLRDDINDTDFDDVPGMTEQLKNNIGLIGISNISIIWSVFIFNNTRCVRWCRTKRTT